MFKSDKSKFNKFQKSFEEENLNENLYKFKVLDILKLKKYLQSKIIGQDHIIEKYTNTFLLNTYRSEKNNKNLGVFFNFGPSGSGKNYIMELIAKQLDFGYYIIDLSQYHYVEMNSLLGATDGYSAGGDSIIENIYDMSEKYGGKMILIFDEIEKGIKTENGNMNTFLTSIMNIINNSEVYTKNNNKKIDFSNFIFVFNSNIGFDEYEKKILNDKKIGFDIENNQNQKKEKLKVDKEFIEDFFKNKLNTKISVLNRLMRGDNFFFFDHIEKFVYEKYFEDEFLNLQNELYKNFDLKNQTLPDIEKFKYKIKNYDTNRGFRGINDIIYIDIKLEIIKDYIFKNEVKIGGFNVKN